ncbi:hypothetical protein Tco_1500771 [Tanacetum coccineum]
MRVSFVKAMLSYMSALLIFHLDEMCLFPFMAILKRVMVNGKLIIGKTCFHSRKWFLRPILDLQNLKDKNIEYKSVNPNMESAAHKLLFLKNFCTRIRSKSTTNQVIDSEIIHSEDQGSQITLFLERYREEESADTENKPNVRAIILKCFKSQPQEQGQEGTTRRDIVIVNQETPFGRASIWSSSSIRTPHIIVFASNVNPNGHNRGTWANARKEKDRCVGNQLRNMTGNLDNVTLAFGLLANVVSFLVFLAQMSKIVVEKKHALKKTSHMSMWHMIYRHMVSGLATESGGDTVVEEKNHIQKILPAKYARAKVKRMLKTTVKPRSAAAPIQNQFLSWVTPKFCKIVTPNFLDLSVA